jgi:hypothetical protein
MQCSIVPGPETASSFETIELRSAAAEMDRLSIAAISILKLDTEGCELPILYDLQPRLSSLDFLYVEYHSEDDRRAIDRLTEGHLLLTRSHAVGPHRGLLMYTGLHVASRYPIFDQMKVIGPRPRGLNS